jgi:hypothetical protein
MQPVIVPPEVDLRTVHLFLDDDRTVEQSVNLPVAQIVDLRV